MHYATPETLTATLVKLAALDKDYAWARAKALARESPMWAEVPRLLTEAIHEARSKDRSQSA